MQFRVDRNGDRTGPINGLQCLEILRHVRGKDDDSFTRCDLKRVAQIPRQRRTAGRPRRVVEIWRIAMPDSAQIGEGAPGTSQEIGDVHCDPHSRFSLMSWCRLPFNVGSCWNTLGFTLGCVR